jgi:NAD(P)-dependent dehydrogenase (short-subunit alcohol dehydrogenase family)
MYSDISNKHVLVTGGSKGIGYSCAQAFLGEGARVTIVSRSQENLDTAVSKLKAEFGSSANIFAVSSDLTIDSDALGAINKAKYHFGNIEVLINSAGAAKRTSAEDLNPNIWMDAMQAKFFSYINIIDPVIKEMAARRSGVIVNVIGMGGKFATPVHLAGGSANAALMLATTGLATAYAPYEVRINGINPGLTFTERLKEGIKVEAKRSNISEDDALKAAIQKIPLKRMALPEEVARVALFLASKEASYVTGQIIGMEGASCPII